MAKTANAVIGTHDMAAEFGLVLYDLELGAPEVKTEYLDLPLESGLIDLSEVVTGRPVYGSRLLTLYFMAEHCTPERWASLTADVASALHGRRLAIVLSFDPDFYYIGRLTCETEKRTYDVSIITVSAVCEPYKRRNSISFATLAAGAISTLANAGDEIVCPTLYTTATGITVAINGGAAYTMPANTRVQVPEMLLVPGDNTVAVTGSGNLTLEWREGKL